jgi:hypothetical protein
MTLSAELGETQLDCIPITTEPLDRIEREPLAGVKYPAFELLPVTLVGGRGNLEMDGPVSSSAVLSAPLAPLLSVFHVAETVQQCDSSCEASLGPAVMPCAAVRFRIDVPLFHGGILAPLSRGDR